MDGWEIYLAAFDKYKAKNFDAALKLVDELKKIVPDMKKVYMLEAWIYFEQDEYLKAFSVLERLVLDFDLDSPYEKNLLAQSLHRMGMVADRMGLTEDSFRLFRLATRMHDDKRSAVMAMDNAIYIANALENFSAADFHALYADYRKYFAEVVPYPKKFYNHAKIRVGYLSGDFHAHPVMSWSLSLVTGLNKNFFETFCYSASATSDFITEKIRSSVDGWREIHGLTDAQAAEVIRGDEIDILFDLSGHTSGNRLGVMIHRPAPIQISGVGYINSTGLDAIDYFLSDVHCAGNSAAYFTEKIICLPHSHICYTPLVTAPIAPAKKNFVMFGCFNQSCKFSDSILNAWKKILDAVPNSRLLLKTKIFNTADGRNFVGERLKNFDIDTARVDMRGFTTNHLADYNDVDIALDTFPYTGGVTTCEALYMGVPVISLYGDRHGTRFGLSILKNVGLDVLAVDSVDDYIRRAVMLAGDLTLLNDLRKNLRGMMEHSPLMNSADYVRDVEEAFIKILR